MIVETNYGKIEGRMAGGMYQFLGIPYAKAPIGKLRFRPAQRPDKWEGVLKAFNYEARCPQPLSSKYKGHFMVGDFFDGPPSSEDCLYLNVWTQGVDVPNRPVTVMIHGGGSYIGASRSDYTDGPHYCGGRNAVFVSFNWRLGPFGFLYLKDFLGEEYETSGSIGLMDQITALKWVKENISYFGGDPNNITIMGQSAGAKSVANLIVCKRAKGLFNRAILESGAIQCLHDKKTATWITEKIFEQYGLNRENARKLLSMSTQDLVDGFYRFIKMYPISVGPVLDDINYPQSIEAYLSEGNVKGLDVLIGYNKHEKGIKPAPSECFEKRKNYLQHRFGGNAEHILSVYRNYLKTMPEYEAWNTIMSEYGYSEASKAFTHMLVQNGAKVWCYRWDLFDELTPEHCAELRYVYRFSAEEGVGGYLPKYKNISEIVNESWNLFASNGDPKTVSMPNWLPYTNATNGTRMYFSTYMSAEPFNLNEYDHDFMIQEFILPDTSKTI